MFQYLLISLFNLVSFCFSVTCGSPPEYSRARLWSGFSPYASTRNRLWLQYASSQNWREADHCDSISVAFVGRFKVEHGGDDDIGIGFLATHKQSPTAYIVQLAAHIFLNLLYCKRPCVRNNALAGAPEAPP